MKRKSGSLNTNFVTYRLHKTAYEWTIEIISIKKVINVQYVTQFNENLEENRIKANSIRILVW